MNFYFQFITLLIFILATVGCTSPSNEVYSVPSVDYKVPTAYANKPTNEGPQVVLPKDGLPHDAPVEWWYFNGHVSDAQGNEFSYHFTVFQTQQDLDGSYPQLFHVSWHDHQAGTVFHSEKSFQQYDDLPENYIDFRVAAWQMKETKDKFVLYFDVQDYSVELNLSKSKKPIMHDGTGFVDMKEAGQTYYYTYSSLDAYGHITNIDTQTKITGTSWMDHQWGDFLENLEIGWDWFSIHLDNGHELMIAYVRNTSTNEFITSYGTYIDLDGNSQHLRSETFTLEAMQDWQSPITLSNYPVKWKLGIPVLDLTLSISAVTEDSEFSPDSELVFSYWEGSTKISGTIESKPISGYGFMELVGY